MSSAYKTLKTSDITVSPYKAQKVWTIPSESFQSYGIELLSGSNNPASSNYNYYRSIRQLYYSYNRPSLATPVPTSEQNFEQLAQTQNNLARTDTILAYDNYRQSTAASGTLEYENRELFPTASNSEISILSIPQGLFGEQIKPGSFSATLKCNSYLIENNDTIQLRYSYKVCSTGNTLINSIPAGGDGLSVCSRIPPVITNDAQGTITPDSVGCTTYNISDNGNGNIYDSSERLLGNILYSHGIVVIDGSQSNLAYVESTTFTSTLTIYENQIRCHVNENEFNQTQNPSALSGSTGLYNNNVTGSDFDPYVTTVGLYSAANELLAVGKLGQPYPVPSNTDITFVVKYDS